MNSCISVSREIATELSISVLQKRTREGDLRTPALDPVNARPAAMPYRQAMRVRESDEAEPNFPTTDGAHPNSEEVTRHA